MKRFGGAEVNHKRQIDGALNGKLGRISPAEDFAGDTARLLESSDLLGPYENRPPAFA